MVGWRFSYRNSNFKSWLWFGQLYSVVRFWFYLNFPSIRGILNSKSYLFEWNKVIVFRTFGSCDFSIETMFNIHQTGWYITCYVWFSVIGEFFVCTQFQCIFCGPVWGLHFSCSCFILSLFFYHPLDTYMKNPFNHIYFYFIYAECIGSLLFWIGIFSLLHCN